MPGLTPPLHAASRARWKDIRPVNVERRPHEPVGPSDAGPNAETSGILCQQQYCLYFAWCSDSVPSIIDSIAEIDG